MSKEKQIIEIKECIDSVYGADCAYYDVDGFAIANEIYNAGYRKQSDGEWIEVDTIDDGWTQYRCNGCGWNTGSYYKEKYDLHRYCPNCGAKMKGGTE